MQANKLNLIHFSATGTTRKTVHSIAEGIEINPVTEHDILQGQAEDVCFTAHDLVVFGVPVYSGRIPAIAIDSLNRFKGSATPAIIVCVYGNREYDDTLLELKDLVEKNHFNVLSAGAFVAEHSIFPAVAHGRPDEQDKVTALEFGKKSVALLSQYHVPEDIPDFSVKGHFPYKPINAIPLRPKGDSKCTKCGVCVKTCPTKAIDEKHPGRTDKTRCISCGHCIHVCPEHARHFGGILYKLGGKNFRKSYSDRKEAEVFYCEKF